MFFLLFVYSLTVFPGSGGAEFVSSGEDGTIRMERFVTSSSLD